MTCSGSERNITSCRYINNTVITNHAQDVGVECQQGQSSLNIDILLPFYCTGHFSFAHTQSSIPYVCVSMFIVNTNKRILTIKVGDMISLSYNYSVFIRRCHKGRRYPSGWWQLLMAGSCGDIFRWNLGYNILLSCIQ